jgi:hypothetical protein
MRNTYKELLDHFVEISDVELPGLKGAQGLKYRGKMFVLFYKGDLTVKLSENRVKVLIETGEGLPHDPGTGKAMKDRVLIPVEKKMSWIKFCEESLNYVRK